MQEVLAEVLDKFEARFTAAMPILDDLLSHDAPSPDDLRKLKEQIPSNIFILDYFYGKLSSPLWLQPLKREGFFRYPPEPVIDEDMGTVKFLRWPLSSYLVRMAKLSSESPDRLNPGVVLESAPGIPVSPNPRIEENIVEVAGLLPTDLAVQLLERTKAGMLSPYYGWVDADKVALLVLQLAKANYQGAALDLLRSTLAILPDPTTPETLDPSSRPFFKPQPRPRIRQYDYEQILKNHLPALVDALGETLLQLLCDLLDEALELSQEGRSVPPDDYSYIWRFSIEQEYPDLPSDELPNALVTAIKDAAIQLGQLDPARAAFDKLIGRRWIVFTRLALHLLAQKPDVAPDLVASTLTNKAYFDERNLFSEYRRLASKAFSQLTPEEKDRILSWIDEGPPPLARPKPSAEPRENSEASEAEDQLYTRR
ncbi:MAG: hypothetical protein ABJA50_09365, partial [Chloroflexota bacterium]